MTILSHTRATGLLAAAIFGFAPLVASAQDVADGDTTGMFAFSGFGAPALDDLPLEMPSEIDVPAPIPPLRVTNLGVTATTPVSPQDEAERVMIRNTWTIGVYR